ncbi:MAG: cytochrome c biogenesis protein CcsA [Planctomycetes bacterium]|nr:cytochrome c biogenesis protein CcsA [Planctomycetota bacterium]
MNIDFIAIGDFSVKAAFLTSLCGVGLVTWGVVKKDSRAIKSAMQAQFAILGLIVTASAILINAFFRGDYTVEYVYAYSEYSLEPIYKFAGLWAGPKGSLLFWSLLLSIFGGIVFFKERNSLNLRFVQGMMGVFFFVQAFYISLIALDEFEFSPFTRFSGLGAAAYAIGDVIGNGRGLNPQLHNYWMMIHPPCLYIGYVGLTIPFCYAMGVLLSGDKFDDWLPRIRFFTIFPWIWLTTGIILGGMWAYIELGWGGYWAWDPVENASFMPWLTGTAFLHSVIIQERRGMFKRWNMILVLLTFTLCTLGAYITRGDIVETVHSFGESKVEDPFQTFLLFVIFAGVALIVYRWNDLKGENKLDHLVSKEASFLLNNVVLLILAGIVLVYTLYEAISEVGVELGLAQVETRMLPANYNRVMPPFFVLLLILTGVGPMLGWRKSTLAMAKRNFTLPTILGVLAIIGLAYPIYAISGIPVYEGTLVLLTIGAAVFTVVTIVMEFVRGTRARMKWKNIGWGRALVTLVLLNRRRYGGYIAHIGGVSIFMGICFSYNYQLEQKTQLGIGERVTVDSFFDYEIALNSVERYEGTVFDRTRMNVSLFMDGNKIADMTPEIRTYKTYKQNGDNAKTSEPAVLRSSMDDVYIFAPQFQGNPAENDFKYLLNIYVNPFINWIWLGAVIIIIGGLIAILPAPFSRTGLKIG